MDDLEVGVRLPAEQESLYLLQNTHVWNGDHQNAYSKAIWS